MGRRRRLVVLMLLTLPLVAVPLGLAAGKPQETLEGTLRTWHGDTFSVLLPTVGWTVHVAARYHERKRSPRDRRLAVGVDVRVELTSAQYFASRDPVLERALRGV